MPRVIRHQKAVENSAEQSPAFLQTPSGWYHHFHHPSRKARPRHLFLLFGPLLPLQVQVRAMHALVVRWTGHETELPQQCQLGHEPDFSTETVKRIKIA